MSAPLRRLCALAGWLFAVLACTAPLPAPDDGPAGPPEGEGAGETVPTVVDWIAFTAEEDRLDALPAKEQGPAFLDLRRRLGADNSAVGQATRRRLTLKLSYAAAVVAAETAASQRGYGDLGANSPPYADRLALSKQAAEIGATYLKQNDPNRALAWVARSRTHATESLWPDDLRNRIHAWFDTRLQGALTAANWAQAREELAVWKKTMGADLAVAQAVDTYAQARAADLIELLNTADPRTVLGRLTEEEHANPGAAAWQTVRDRVALTLDRAFQAGLTSRNIPAAEAALADQTEIARDYHFAFEQAPIASNKLLLEKLVRDLQPSPIQRTGGHVRAVQFRIEVMQTVGLVVYRHRDLTFNGLTWFPVAIGDWRIYNGDSNPWWFGFNMTGLQNNGGKAFRPTSRFTTEAFFLFGRRTATGSGSLGIGGAFNQLSFGDPTTELFSTSRTVTPTLRLDWEQMLGANWTIYGIAEVGVSLRTNLWMLRAGTRYYFNHNFSVGLNAMMSEVNVAADGAILGYHASMRLIGPSMMMQF